MYLSSCPSLLRTIAFSNLFRPLLSYFCVCQVGRGQKQSLSITNTKFFKHCLPGVVRTAGYDAHNFVVHIGIDRDDGYWNTAKRIAKIKDFEAPRNIRFSPVIVSGGTFVKAINEVAKIVYRDGMQYFLRIREYGGSKVWNIGMLELPGLNQIMIGPTFSLTAWRLVLILKISTKTIIQQYFQIGFLMTG